MDKIIKNILYKIEDEGFEAYLVGGFVRDFLLKRNTYDVDICTNALPKDLHRIFPGSSNSNNYGGFNLKIKQYNIDITTYRKELKYENRKPVEVVYINNLLEDLKRRDFTINAICMDENERIIDPFNAIEDIQNHQIKLIGDLKTKLQDDPLRILRAIRFATILDFELDENLINEIKKQAKLVSTLSGVRIKEELNPILLSEHYKRGLELLKSLGIADALNMSYGDVIKCSDIHMMWAQINCAKIPFTNVEKDYIIKLKELMKEGSVTNQTLFKYGLYLNMAISDYFSLDKKKISKLFHDMPIKSEKDLNISVSDIIKLLDIEPSKKIKEIKRELCKLILTNELKNSRKDLLSYLEHNKRKWQDE